MRISLHAVVAALVLTSLTAFSSSSLAAESQPNILLIVADDLGYGDVGAYNAESKIETPQLDRLAAGSLLMTDAHATASWCIPTRFSIMTGRYPIGVDPKDRGRAVIDDSLATLPGTLRDAGYATSMTGKWHLGFSAGETDLEQTPTARLEGGPLDRGFDRYYGIPRSLDIPPYYMIRDRGMIGTLSDSIGDANSEGWSRIQGEFWRAGLMTEGFEHVQTTPDIVKESLAEVDRLTHGDRPWFLQVCLPSPHTPWVPTQEFAGRSVVPLYGDFMMQVDDAIGRLIAAADTTGSPAETIVIVTSDNGPVWLDEDEAKYDHVAAGPYRGMKGDAWEGGHRVPMIVRWTGRIEPRFSDAMWCHADFMATLCEAAAVDAPDTAIDSASFLAHWTENAEPPRSEMLQQSSRKFYSYRDGDMKLIPQLGSGGFTKPAVRKPEGDEPSMQLYDLEADPGETTNLAAVKPDVLERMTARRAELLKGRVEDKQAKEDLRGRAERR